MERVRRAVLTDATAIAAVHRESRAAYYGDQPDPDDGREAMWEHLLGVEGGVTFVVEDRDVVVAFMSARHLDHYEPVLELSSLYVQPGRFGRGTGKRLHEVFESERRLGEGGFLEVWEGNQRAIDFYRRHGWVATSTSRPGPHDTPFITYRLPAG
ncbi:GNAT family N-acetyltransferase [Nocardioides okcheonensis]|uniref:GNAT family N-acetyltransferase n=1 Tax=Nocardioides okcheonensis TaxID=2894081 RepID=UPI001E37599E|nr:GNAT family N-acetyltransferase [Nocardioides okcheonensis]UFN45215.1 GNAT family N-acetyltransferase [Nocardioides okcheonensis]